METALIIGSHRLAQLHQACVGGVFRVPIHQGLDAYVADMGRRGEIRLANAEGDHIIHLCHNIEKAADARGLNLLNFGIEQVLIVHIRFPPLFISMLRLNRGQRAILKDAKACTRLIQ